ncbi:hypothetical protein [Flavobacterium aquicola]|uniref:Uncharacterized protein n=1 Tax=Flavobacterium aquicola TaxID=1682742 RepID=A0A3E0E461_9FLAO|nr:hypothetical protein [Flavobacterium aquicola]REG93001.1 hypothetical protein C8P67_114102 [Flavobacterium aquicola]
MKTKPITEYSKEALENIGTYIQLNDWEKEPIIKKITFYNFTDLMCSISAILEAIEIIGYDGQQDNRTTCANLASVARKMLPNEELAFMDRLLIKRESTKDDFITIKNM